MTIYIEEKTYKIIKTFVKNCPYEISWMGKVKIYKDGFMLEKIKLMEQYVTRASTILQARDIGRVYGEIIREEGDLTGWKCWGHSHASMDVFWSGTDTDTIADFDNETKNDNWWLSIEFNHKMKWLARLDIFNPVHIVHNFDKLEVLETIDLDILDFCEQEMERKVKILREKPIKKELPPSQRIIGQKDPLTEMIDAMKNRNNKEIEEVKAIELKS